MHLKTQLTNVGQDVKPLRYNIKKKFKKSSTEAFKFLNLCKETCDNKTVQEAEAYYSILASNYKLFKREYNEALELLKSASKIYDSISKTKDAIESIAYKEKINSLKMLIRLCQYNLSVR